MSTTISSVAFISLTVYAVAAQLNCHTEVTASSSTLSETVSATLNSQTCSNPSFCQWSVEQTTSGSEISYMPSWGCSDDLVCDVYGTNDGCISSTKTVERCSDDERTSTELATYYFCCNGADDCNYVDADISSCSASTSLQQYEDALAECVQYESGCTESSDSNDDNEEDCDDALETVMAAFGCYCNALNVMYSAAPTSGLQTAVIDGTGSVPAQEMLTINTALKATADFGLCPLVQLSCDPATGAVTSGALGQFANHPFISFGAVMVVFTVRMML